MQKVMTLHNICPYILSISYINLRHKKSNVQLLDIYTPKSSTSEDKFIIMIPGFTYTFNRYDDSLKRKEI